MSCTTVTTDASSYVGQYWANCPDGYTMTGGGFVNKYTTCVLLRPISVCIRHAGSTQNRATAKRCRTATATGAARVFKASVAQASATHDAAGR